MIYPFREIKTKVVELNRACEICGKIVVKHLSANSTSSLHAFRDKFCDADILEKTEKQLTDSMDIESVKNEVSFEAWSC